MLAEKLGNGYYQIYTVAAVSIMWMFMTFVDVSPTFILMTPTFKCGDETNLSEDEACHRLTECTIEVPFTLTAENSLYC